MDCGVCYYPEHWPRERWEDDISRMAGIGIRFIRMLDFAWSYLEPSPGYFDFSWVDRVLDTCDRFNIKVILCTPTASPPLYLSTENPDILMQLEDGSRAGPFSRRYVCHNSPVYTGAVARLVTRMGEHFSRRDTVTGWQIDNEFACQNIPYCYCDHCTEAFRKWLRNKYATIQLLNEAWGTPFWSNLIDDFSQVELPRKSGDHMLPGHWLDFRRFVSDSIMANAKMQYEILKRYDRNWEITHNNYEAPLSNYDAFALARSLDLACTDCYSMGRSLFAPSFYEASKGSPRIGDPDIPGLNFDTTRGMTGVYDVYEIQPGQINWSLYNPMPEKGAVKLWAMQAAFHGARKMAWFRWRKLHFGPEYQHYGFLDYAGEPDTDFEEKVEVIREIHNLGDLHLLDDHTRCGITWDVESMWALENLLLTIEYNPDTLLRKIYGAMRQNSVDVKVVDLDSSLDSLTVLFVPFMEIMGDKRHSRLRKFVEAGGHLVLFPRFARRNMSGAAYQSKIASIMSDLTGAWVEFQDNIPAAAPESFTFMDKKYTWNIWADALHVTGEEVEVLGTFEDGRLKGYPSAIRNRYGQGTVTTLAVIGNDQFLTDAVLQNLEYSGIPATSLPSLVRYTRRGQHLFAANWSREKVTVNIPEGYETVTGEATMGPCQYLIMKKKEG